MAIRQRMIRRIELMAFCGMAALESWYCQLNHWCMCGHLRHGAHLQWEPWITDSIGILGIVGAGVVGIRGGISGARLTGILAVVIVVIMMSSYPNSSPIGVLTSIILGPFFIYHLWCLVGAIRKDKCTAQGENSNPVEIPSK